MGNNVHYTSESISYIRSDDLWIEGLAIQQLHTTANLPHMQRVVGMPDLHPGRGYPIGAAFFSLGHLYPALVGNDIGCGMALWQTDILARKYNADKFEKKLSAMGDVAQASWLDEHLPENLLTHPWRSALGSIGGGNHFAELQQVEQVVDNDRFQQAGLMLSACCCWRTADRAASGNPYCSTILRLFRTMAWRKVALRLGIIWQNMMMRWLLPA